MTRCTNRRTAILTLILGLTLLLCGCQVGGGVFVLPDISTNDSTQGKTQLLAALNKHYYTLSMAMTLPLRLSFPIFKKSAPTTPARWPRSFPTVRVIPARCIVPTACWRAILPCPQGRARSATPRWTPAYRMMPFSHPLPRRCSKTAGFSSCRLTFHPAPIAVRSVLPSAPSADRPS